MTTSLRSARLELVPATLTHLRADLAGRDALSRALRAHVSDEWPPELYDEAATRWSLDWLIAHPHGAGWNFYYLIAAAPAPVLVGLAGFKGFPDEEGTVEIGYSILPERRRRGYASEAVRALVAFAFADDRVRRVVAETLPDMSPSIGVLEKCGFTFTGAGAEEGAIRFVLARPQSVAPSA